MTAAAPAVLSLADVADTARALSLPSFKHALGAAWVLVGRGAEPDDTTEEWSYSTAAHPSHGPVPSVAMEATVVLPVKKARADIFPGVVLVGRAASNDIELDSASVSKLHARIRLGDTLSVSDAGSRNGTFLGGKPVEGEVAVRPFAVLTFGRRSFTVQDVASLHALLRKMP